MPWWRQCRLLCKLPLRLPPSMSRQRRTVRTMPRLPHPRGPPEGIAPAHRLWRSRSRRRRGKARHPSGRPRNCPRNSRRSRTVLREPVRPRRMGSHSTSSFRKCMHRTSIMCRHHIGQSSARSLPSKRPCDASHVDCCETKSIHLLQRRSLCRIRGRLMHQPRMH